MLTVDDVNYLNEQWSKQLQELLCNSVNRVVATELELCAKLCEERMQQCGKPECHCHDGYHLAAMIRERKKLYASD